MSRHTALWALPVLSIVAGVVLIATQGEVVDAPADGSADAAAVASLDAARSLEREANLARTLEKSVAARDVLAQHVRALHVELTEMRAERTAIVAEAKLWRDSYDVLSARFDELSSIASALSASATVREPGLAGSAGTVPASFTRSVDSAPAPAHAVIVR